MGQVGTEGSAPSHGGKIETSKAKSTQHKAAVCYRHNLPQVSCAFRLACFPVSVKCDV